MFIRRMYSILFLLSICCSQSQALAKQTDALIPGILVLRVEGSLSVIRESWIQPQQIHPGMLLTTTDRIFPENASLMVVCPQGEIREFLPSELLPNDVIKCPTTDMPVVIDAQGQQTIDFQRGGRQEPGIPYLIAPRSTIVRNSYIELKWNAIKQVSHYQITVRGTNNDKWTSELLSPDTLVQDGQATLEVPMELAKNIAYSVDICVLNGVRKHCTSDPDWAGGNLSFYYVETPNLDRAEAQLIASLGPDSPESRIARATLYDQTVFHPTASVSVGVYQEAIDLLMQLIKENSDSAIASSPEPYLLLGDLYQNVKLPQSARDAYENAARLAESGTLAAAKAAWGQAVTAPSEKDAIGFYNQSFDHYKHFLNQHALIQQCKALCEEIKEGCKQVNYCASTFQ